MVVLGWIKRTTCWFCRTFRSTRSRNRGKPWRATTKRWYVFISVYFCQHKQTFTKGIRSETM